VLHIGRSVVGWSLVWINPYGQIFGIKETANPAVKKRNEKKKHK
jgi:hypothetical protein